jgi:quercetin dioxygenase-like cupin family protein
MSSAAPVIEEANGGELLWFGGGLLTLKVTSEQSGGAFFLLEDVAPRGKTTPLHLHPDDDETFYVLEGELLVHIDGTERTVGPGAVAFVPRGTPHAFLVTSDEARWLGFVTPGTNIERFMRDAGDAVTDPTSPIPPLDIARIKAAGERTGAMVALGPPPFELAAKHPA